MRQLFGIAMLQFRLQLKNKGSLAMMFFMPLAFTAIFGLALGGSPGSKKIPLAVVNLDGTFAARQVVTALQDDELIKVTAVNESDLKQLFADHRVQAGLVIPAGFEKAMAGGAAPALTVVTAPGGGNSQVAVRPAVTRAAAAVAQNYTLAMRLNQTNPDEAYAKVANERAAVQIGLAESKEAAAVKAGSNSLMDSSLGFTVVFVMMMVLMMSGVILQERQNGTWGRLLTTPASRAAVLGGYLLSFYVTGAFQFSVLVLASSLLFKVAWGPILPLAVVASSLILCTSGLGLLLAGLVKTAEQQKAVGMLVVISTSFLGGVYWPLDLMSKTMQRIGHLTPQAWAMDGLREVMFRGGAWPQLATPLGVLLGLAVVFMSIGLLRVRFD